MANNNAGNTDASLNQPALPPMFAGINGGQSHGQITVGSIPHPYAPGPAGTHQAQTVPQVVHQPAVHQPAVQGFPFSYAPAYGPPVGTYGQAAFPAPVPQPQVYPPPPPPASTLAHTYPSYPPQNALPPTAFAHHQRYPPSGSSISQLLGNPYSTSGNDVPRPNLVQALNVQSSTEASQTLCVVSEDDMNYVPQFRSPETRAMFVRNVLWMVALQWALVAGCTAAALFVVPVKEYLHERTWIIWTSVVLFFMVLSSGLCNFAMVRKSPFDLTSYVAITFSMSTMFASIVAHHDSEAVFLSSTLLFALILGLALLASLCNFDITNLGGLLFGATILLLIATLVGVFWIHSIFKVLLAGAGSVLFSVYLMYDLQILMSDKERMLGPQEHIVGAFCVYLDIVSIFLRLITCSSLMKK